MSEFVGVILAAGKGSRIAPLSESWPKPLLPVCNQPIVEHQIDAMRSLGIRRVFVVVGHLGDRLRAALGTGERLGVEITYVEQHRPQGIAHALLTLDGLIDSPLMVFLGDIFLKFRNLSSALEPFDKLDASGVLIVKHEPVREYIQRNFAVLLDDRGRVTRVIEKPKNPPNNLKGCGVYLFQPSVFEALRRTPRSPMRNEYEITDAIQIFIDMGHAVFTAPVVEWDMNVTFPQDLLDCNLRVLAENGGGSKIADSAVINRNASIKGSVIGPHVSILHPIRVEQTVVLEGTTVADPADLVKALVIDNQVVVTGVYHNGNQANHLPAAGDRRPGDRVGRAAASYSR